MIVLQLKSTQRKKDLEDISLIIKQISKKQHYNIKGHEIHQLDSVINKTSLSERANMIADFCSKNEIEYLTYHMTRFDAGDNIWDERRRHKLENSILLSIQEIEKIHDMISLKHNVVLILHITSQLPIANLPITSQKKFQMIKKAEDELLKIVSKGFFDSKHIEISIENSYPKYDGDYATVSPFHPVEIIRLKEYNIKATLDISHYQLYLNYLKNGTGNLVGDLDRKIYGVAPGWDSCIKILSNNLNQLHISDAKGFDKSGEGLPLGEGEIPIVEILTTVDSSVKKTIRATIELKEGHLNSNMLQMQSLDWLLEKVPHHILA